MTFGTLFYIYLVTTVTLWGVTFIPLATDLRTRWTQGYSYRPYPWYHGKPIHPGVFWIYGDSRRLTRLKWRLFGYVFCIALGFVSVALVSGIVGLGLGGYLSNTNLVDRLFAYEMPMASMAPYLAAALISWLYIVSIPYGRMYRTIKVSLAVMAMFGVIVWIVMTLRIDNVVDGTTSGVCYFFSDKQACEFIYD